MITCARCGLEARADERTTDGTYLHVVCPLTRVTTADWLYVHTRGSTPTFLVQSHPFAGQRFTLGGLRTYVLPERWQYDEEFKASVHGKLHEKLGTSCSGRLNEAQRRSGDDGPYGALVRNGYDGQGGCFDTPLIDLDEVLVTRTGEIQRVYEHKQQRERFSQWQQRVLDALPVPWELA